MRAWIVFGYEADSVAEPSWWTVGAFVSQSDADDRAANALRRSEEIYGSVMNRPPPGPWSFEGMVNEFDPVGSGKGYFNCYYQVEPVDLHGMDPSPQTATFPYSTFEETGAALLERQRKNPIDARPNPVLSSLLKF